MKLSKETQIEAEQVQPRETFTLGTTPIKRVYHERYLGSRFDACYTQGESNISQRVGMAKTKLETGLAAVMANKEVS